MSARDRQDRIAGWLARRPSATVAELAERFEISERTLYRDLAALRARGVDVRGEPGRGGGLQLVSPAPLTVRMEVDEIVGLYLSVAVMRQSRGLPYARSAVAAVDKLVCTLPPQRAKELRQFLRRIVIGRPASPAVAASVATPDPELLARFEEAFSRRRAVAFRYLDRNGVTSERRAELHGLLVQAPAWYVLAHDLGKDAPKMFRLDRMSRVTVLPDVAFVPRPAQLIATLVDPHAYPDERAPS